MRPYLKKKETKQSMFCVEGPAELGCTYMILALRKQVRQSQALGQPNIHSESLPQITAQVFFVFF